MRTNEELIKIIMDRSEFKAEDLQDLEDYQLSYICEDPQYWASSGKDVQEIAGDAEDRYMGQYNNMAEFAEELIQEMYNLSIIPTIIVENIDWNGVAKDLRHDYYMTEEGHVFKHKGVISITNK